MGREASGGPALPGGAVYRSAATAIVIAWSLRLIGLVSVLVLARVLTPRDFGIVALATSVLALVDIFSALGLRQALLRIREPERAHYDTAWTLQLIVLALLALVLVVIAPLAAGFYEEPILATLIPILAASFVIDGLTNIRVVDFERHLQLGRDLKMRISVRLTTLAITVTAALVLQNYWALVIGLLLQSALNAVASYMFIPYRPRLTLAKRADLLGVSLWMFLASAAHTLHTEAEKIVVGRISSRSGLGLYAVSKDLSSIFTEEIATALNRVTFVTTAQTGEPLSRNPQRLPAMLGAYALIAAPLGLGLSATAGEVLPTLLGAQWTGAAPFLAIIAPACALYAVYKLVVSTLQASGDARAAAILSIVGALLVVASTVTVALAGYSASAVALAVLVSTGALLAGGTMLLARKGGVPFAALAMAVARPFLAAVIMLLVLGAWPTDGYGELAALALKVPAGAALYALAAAGLWIGQGRPEGAEQTLLVLLRQWSDGKGRPGRSGSTL